MQKSDANKSSNPIPTEQRSAPAARCTKLLLIILALLLGALPVQPAMAQAPAESGETNQTIYLPSMNRDSNALCRFGVNKDVVFTNGDGATVRVNMAPLRAGWYISYSASSQAASVPPGVAFFPTVRVRQIGNTDDYEYSIYANHADTTEEMLKREIRRHPGAEWFIGNEPDRITIPNVVEQDESEPHVYAKAYHDLYHLIKAEDPTATIIAGSIVQPTPVRIQYLDRVLAAYQQMYGVPMPVDAWATHNFILNEVRGDWGAEIPPGIDVNEGEVVSVYDLANVDTFVRQIQRFRQWLAANGYRNKPVYVSEYGILFPHDPAVYDWDYSPAVVNEYMDRTFDYMLNTVDPNLGYPADGNRLVQRFSWYSVHDGFFNGDLHDKNGVLTEMGANYVAYTSGIASATDFYPVSFSATTSGNAINLTARIANSGNVAAPHTVIVRFYNGDPAGGGVQIGPDRVRELTGCGDNVYVTYRWEGPGSGPHNLYVEVEPLRTNRESNFANNKLGPVAPAAAGTDIDVAPAALVPGS